MELYQLVAPTCAWWPTGQSGYKNYHNASSKGYAKVSYNVNYKLKSLQYIILSDVCNYTVTITASGPNYNIGGSTGVFSAGDTMQVSYGTVVAYGNNAAMPNSGFLKTTYNKG